MPSVREPKFGPPAHMVRCARGASAGSPRVLSPKARRSRRATSNSTRSRLHRKTGHPRQGGGELFEDSAPDLGEFIASEVAYSFAAKEDDCGFNGDGTSVYVGISGLIAKLTGTKSAVAAGAGHNTFATIDLNDITNLMAGVLATAIPGAAWYVSSIAYAQVICRLAGTMGNGLVARTLPDGRIEANFLGYPVRFSGKLVDGSTSMTGKAMLMFGCLAQSSVLFERRQKTIVAIGHERALVTGDVWFRGVQRCDIVNHTVGEASTPRPHGHVGRHRVAKG